MREKKKDLPAMPFYFGDWRKDPGVRALDLDVRMIWFEMLGFMWDSSERGFLTVNKKPITNFVIAKLVGVDITKMEQALEQMEQFDVFSRREDGAIYSRKMVRDEDIRAKRAAAGSAGMQARYKVKKSSNKRYNKTVTKGITNAANANANATEDVITNADENGKDGTEGKPFETFGSGGLPFQCRQIFLNTWEGYQWDLKDSQAVGRLIGKIKGVITDSQKRKGEIIGATDQKVIDFLTMLLQKLPKWYAERNRDVEGLDSKFNRIVNEIINANGQTSGYDSLKRKLAEEIITATSSGG